ncbi:DUF6199 family natural product biosynthesis protein [Mycolicibacterium arenosum]|uniref:DUF6199 domain-containing protein n=1 Tax=Mycolicibacterium arenosum TaxID=2952157 RepID=A0ABT1M0E6_9MYCO|nr:DUF6199 family natural product biosynthesis protein [Mycolicibacterium sp. CAU 1645]MCP9272330.1 hypothetical protein [Mycolicibacterium sp. CAU 1645]
MGLGIVTLLIGIPIGLLMLFRPREVWKFTEGWKFRNPEANEPSGVAYALSGVGVIAVTLILAGLAFTKPDDNASVASTTTRSKPPTTRSQPTTPSYSNVPRPPAPFTAPKPQSRGALPVIGYMTNDGVTTVYYYAPVLASATAPPDRARPCDVAPRIEGVDTEHVVVNVDLMWAPTLQEDVPQGWNCRVENNDDPLVARSLVIGVISPTAELITSKPVPNMRLPKLAEPPRPLADPPPAIAP